MPEPSRRSKIATLTFSLFLALSSFLALCLGAAAPASAQPFPCPGNTNAYPADKTICTMTIHIFNDDPNHYIYPVLETGQANVNPTVPSGDLWMQAWFSVLNSQVVAKPYARNWTYRLYINGGTGIPPGRGISVVLPLYTQLVSDLTTAAAAKPQPSKPMCNSGSLPACAADTFIDWWNGGNIQIYTSTQMSNGQSSGIPPSLVQLTMRPQTAIIPPAITPTPIVPTCIYINPPSQKCDEPLVIFRDIGGAPNYGGSQLVEYTLGANNLNKNPGHDYINSYLDTSNVDFDVSYVNVAWAPVALGVFGNNQVGYTGTPITIDQFTGIGNYAMPSQGVTNFLNVMYPGWPRFFEPAVNAPTGMAWLKVPSLLEVFQSLAGGAPPATLSPVLPTSQWDPNDPANYLKNWTPIQALFNNWKTWVGSFTVTATPPYYKKTLNSPDPKCTGTYQLGTPINDWCTAMVAQRDLLLANYTQYVPLFGGPCTGMPVDLTDPLLVGKFYGFTPWVEGKNGVGGCAATANLLQNTKGYCVGTGCPPPNGTSAPDGKKDYSNYNTVKVAYDKLNYNLFPNPPPAGTGYVMNPYAQFIHGKNIPNLNIPCSYAYSVDDAQGNVQADGQGFIIDVGSNANLENQQPCNPPITVTLGVNLGTINFAHYAVCTTDVIKPVNLNFASFVVSAKNPSMCPIYLWDNKAIPSTDMKLPSGQRYTVLIDVDPSKITGDPLNLGDPLQYVFPPKPLPTDQVWMPPGPWPFNPMNPNPTMSTTTFAGCKNNYPPNNGATIPPFEPSSQFWCCDQKITSGVRLFSVRDLSTAHQAIQYNAGLLPAELCTDASTCRIQVDPCNSDR